MNKLSSRRKRCTCLMSGPVDDVSQSSLERKVHPLGSWGPAFSRAPGRAVSLDPEPSPVSSVSWADAPAREMHLVSF
ncbi:hypothetical protein CesoFtcFv8_022649 [Champsocephalus esox]|uniref:Uncharacterized protein n=1 Tax=Champsocephalus esox TaxID=159716 RepID=A0AAN8B6L6_9TELE|nr:hypothetical protein CesoFtcFv8_022649 [Champsocephalus esox]